MTTRTGKYHQGTARDGRARSASTQCGDRREADNTDVECSCVGVKEGRAYTVRQLLDGLMLVSGNDAANTLAEGLGGYQAAVARMNAKAVAWARATPTPPRRRA